MDWWVILVLLIVVPVILFPAVFVWYLNAGGLYAAIKEGRFRVSGAIARRIRIGLGIIVPVGIYAGAIIFSFSHFGWQVTLALALTLPIVLLVPVLIWAAVVSGLYQVVRDTLRRRAAATRRGAVRAAEEPVTREVT